MRGVARSGVLQQREGRDRDALAICLVLAILMPRLAWPDVAEDFPA